MRDIQELSKIWEELFRQNKYEEAELHLREALLLFPENFKVLCDLGYVLLIQKKYEKAEIYFREVLMIIPDSPKILGGLGYTLVMQKKFKEAEMHFKKALEIAPHAYIIIGNLGYVLFKQRKYKEAEPYLRKAIELNPQSIQFSNNLVQFLLEQSRFKEAEEIVKHSIELNPNDSNKWNLLSRLHQRLNMPIYQDDFREIKNDKSMKYLKNSKHVLGKFISLFNEMKDESNVDNIKFRLNCAKSFYKIYTEDQSKKISFCKMNKRLKRNIEDLYKLSEEAPLMLKAFRAEVYCYIVSEGRAIENIYKRREELEEFRKNTKFKFTSPPSLTTWCLKSVIDYGCALKDALPEFWEINKEVWAKRIKEEMSNENCVSHLSIS